MGTLELLGVCGKACDITCLENFDNLCAAILKSWRDNGSDVTARQFYHTSRQVVSCAVL